MNALFVQTEDASNEPPVEVTTTTTDSDYVAVVAPDGSIVYFLKETFFKARA